VILVDISQRSTIVRLREFILEKLAVMVVGDEPHFPYRSSSFITRFFARCGLPFEHDGSTRWRWALERLKELNLGTSQSVDLPSDEIVRVLRELFDVDDFDRAGLSREAALEAMNLVLAKHALSGYFASDGQFCVRNTGTGQSTAAAVYEQRPLSAEEIAQRRQVADFLERASEDEFTQNLLVPFFQRMGFRRVTVSGHKEKTLEYGKDLWMKFQLPTGHLLYFGAQIKRDKLDARGGSGDNNTATVLDQVRMAIDHPIFDPEAGRKVLVDHVFVISAGEITRAARNWLVEQLDRSQRRQIIFMDRDEFLDHSARILLDLRIAVESDDGLATDDNVPF
jgi:hypothetical protein